MDPVGEQAVDEAQQDEPDQQDLRDVEVVEGEPENLGVVEILVVPAVQDSIRVNDISTMWLSQKFTSDIQEYLDRYRLLTTNVVLHEPEYIGIKVIARVVANEYSDPDLVATRIDQHLHNFLNPLVPYPEVEDRDRLLESGWQGWSFGKDLFLAEIFSLIQRVPGVRYVLDVDLQKRTVEKDTARVDETTQELMEDVEDRVIGVPDDALIVSLDHEITMVDLDQAMDRNVK